MSNEGTGRPAEMNRLSMPYATRRMAPWTPEDDEIILNEWVAPGPSQRDELGVARKLRRTWAACGFRASILAGRRTGAPGSRRAPEPIVGDWMAEWCAETGSAPVEDW